MKLFDCLPQEIADELKQLDNLRELRIRNGGAVKVNVAGHWYYLCKRLLSTNIASAITVGNVCDDIVRLACANSVYAHEKTLSQGYFTLEDGVRIGVCGQIFGDDNNVFRNYTSLCCRIPHYINCVDNKLLNDCLEKNVVVIGRPASGKTTFLRDIAVKLAARYNVLVADERGELFYDEYLLSSSGCDVLKWCSKSYAFDVGLRSMSPQYLICDELSESDVSSVKSCLASGVNLMCSAHALDENDFDRRFGLLERFDKIINLNFKQF